MKLNTEGKRKQLSQSRDVLDTHGEKPTELEFDPIRDISDDQKEMILSYYKSDEVFLNALGLNSSLFAPSDTKKLMDSYVNTNEISDVFFSLKNEDGDNRAETALFPLALLKDRLTPKYVNPIAAKIWEVVQERFRSNIKGKLLYALQILYGAESFFPAGSPEVQAYRAYVQTGIQTELETCLQKISISATEGYDYKKQADVWLELALISLNFPGLNSKIYLPPHFGEMIKRDLAANLKNYETIQASMIAFAGTVLSKIPKPRLSQKQPLPARLLAI